MARNDPDSWASWHEESFKLDVDTPLAISRSLWDELPQTETDPRALFSSTPAADVMQAGMLPPLAQQELVQTQGDAEQDSPRQKRRRVLFFPHGDYEEIPPSEEMVTDRGDLAESSGWCLDPDDSTLEQPTECWMDACFNNSEDQSIEAMTTSVQAPSCRTPSDSSEGMQQGGSVKTPVTPISVSRPSRGKKKQQLMRKVASPVAYPFALVKPCGATGDVTLSDLNQRLQTPRAKPVRRLNRELVDSAQGSGLSGKSVVALTKIHTEGNGSITIMRTKG